MLSVATPVECTCGPGDANNHKPRNGGPENHENCMATEHPNCTYIN